MGSPRLDGLMGEARALNPDLAAAAARVRQADAQVKIAGGRLLPTLDAGLGTRRSRTPPTSASSRNTNPQGVDLHSLTFSASYELDFWGRNQSLVDAAAAQADASRFDAQTTRLSVESSVATTYFQALAYRARLDVANANLANALHILDAIRARAEVGTAAGLDIAQQETVVAEQRALIPPLTQGLRQSTYALAILVGRTPDTLALGEEGLDGLAVPQVMAGLPSGLLARRPDVAYAESRLRAANANIRAAEAALLPDITLTAQGGIESMVLSNLLQPGSVLYSIGASLVQPIFRGGVLEGGVELQQAAWDEMVESYRKAALAAFFDVETALASVEMSARQEEAEQVAVSTARRAYDIADAQLMTGTVDILTVLQTQRSVFTAEDLLVQARLARIQAAVGLFKALGGGWQAPPA